MSYTVITLDKWINIFLFFYLILIFPFVLGVIYLNTFFGSTYIDMYVKKLFWVWLSTYVNKWKRYVDGSCLYVDGNIFYAFTNVKVYVWTGRSKLLKSQGIYSLINKKYLLEIPGGARLHLPKWKCSRYNIAYSLALCSLQVK